MVVISIHIKCKKEKQNLIFHKEDEISSLIEYRGINRVIKGMAFNEGRRDCLPEVDLPQELSFQ